MLSPRISAAVLLLSLNYACSQELTKSTADASSSEVSSVSAACPTAVPNVTKARFAHFSSKLIAFSGLKPNHRGRDVIAVSGSHTPIYIQAKFAYGPSDKDLEDEKVQLFIADCSSSRGYMSLGTTTTTTGRTKLDSSAPGMDNVKVSGGRIYANPAKIQSLPAGRYKVAMVVLGDSSSTELFINVLPKGQKVVVSDIDGTLTSSELAAASEVLNIHPRAHPGAAKTMQVLAAKGYAIFYLTARPEWLMAKTRDWLNVNGFPAGTVHTTNSLVGANGNAAAQYKIDELAHLKSNTQIVPTFAFGNKPSDVKAFGASDIAPEKSYYYKLGADAEGGTDFSDYLELASEFRNLSAVSH